MTKSGDTHAIGLFSYDPQTEELLDASGRAAPLRPQTRRVLAALVARRGETVSKNDLMEEVWSETHVTDDSLVQCISEIRKALGPRDGKLLRTVPRRGYRLLPADGEDAPHGGRRRHAIRRLGVAAAVLVALLVAVAALWTARGPPPTEAKVVAVLPFANLSGDAAQDYFSIGLAEDLRTDLSKISALTVLSRSATFAYRSRQNAAAAVARNLGASHLIDGSVRRSGDYLRISVQLVDAATGASIWAERYDRDLTDLFAVQDDVRMRILSALAVRLAPGEADRMRAGGTLDILAYDLLLRGRHAEAALNRDGVTQAVTLYEKAVAADPAYGEAHARLANMYDFAARFGWSDDAGRDRKLAVRMAERAIQLGPQNPFAHWTLGRILSRQAPGDAGTRARAMEAVNTAITLDPNDADAYAFISLLHIGGGRPAEARSAIERAFRLNPAAPSWYIQNRGVIFYMDDRIDPAISDFERAAEQNPTAPFTRLWLAAAYARAGRIDDAKWEIDEAISLGAPATVSAALETNPIFQDAQYLAVYEEGLRRAGLPD